MCILLHDKGFAPRIEPFDFQEYLFIYLFHHRRVGSCSDYPSDSIVQEYVEFLSGQRCYDIHSEEIPSCGSFDI